jgi:hypothetical protein
LKSDAWRLMVLGAKRGVGVKEDQEREGGRSVSAIGSTGTVRVSL